MLGRQRFLGWHIAVGGRVKTSGDAVLGCNAEYLCQHLAHLRLGKCALKERCGLSTNQSHDRGYRLRLERLRQLRIGINVNLDQDHAAGIFRHHSFQDGRELLAGLTPGGPQIDNYRNGLRQLDVLGERGVDGIHDERNSCRVRSRSRFGSGRVSRRRCR